MNHLIGGAGELGWVAAEAVLLYLTAVLCLRFSGGRTLADLSPFDFVAVAAVGSVVGRLPSASDSSYLAGAATLVALLVAHGCVSRLRRFPNVSHSSSVPRASWSRTGRSSTTSSGAAG